MRDYFSKWKFPLFMAIVICAASLSPWVNTFIHELGHLIFGLFTLGIPGDFHVASDGQSGYYRTLFFSFTSDGGAVAIFLSCGWLLLRFFGFFGMLTSVPWFLMGIRELTTFSSGDIRVAGGPGFFMLIVAIDIAIVLFLGEWWADRKAKKLAAEKAKQAKLLASKRVPLPNRARQA